MPASLFYNLEMQGISAAASPQQLMVAMYDNGHLFPRIAPANHSREVTSCVVGTKLGKSEENQHITAKLIFSYKNVTLGRSR